MVAPGELSTELGAISKPAGSQPVEVCAADPQVMRGIRTINFPFIKLLEDLLKERIGEALG